MPIPKSELSPKLVMPAYRHFCRMNSLPFHFWDELPKANFNLKIADAERELHTEAVSLFNALKPEYCFYRGNVVSFKILCCDGNFESAAQPLKDFLLKAAQDQKRLQKLERVVAILCDALALSLGIILTFAWLRYVAWSSFLPDIIPLVVFAVSGSLTWRWLLNTRATRTEQRTRTELQDKLRNLRAKIATTHKTLGVESPLLTAQDQLEDKLGTALVEHILNRLGDEADDPEMQEHVLHDINSLLLTAGPGAEVERRHLKSASLLESHLRASMQIPAQTLMRELPKRTAAWLASEPHWKSPERPRWAEEGRHLLDQARLNQDNDHG
jgi:hypothetical protein